MPSPVLCAELWGLKEAWVKVFLASQEMLLSLPLPKCRMFAQVTGSVKVQ